jgi:UDP-2,3-diacylglucosamine pyrophosphatase LpxH
MAKTQRAADGVDEKAEDRAAEIAEKIGECAKERKVRPCDLTWYDFREYGAIAWGENRLGVVRKDITRLGGFNAIRDAYHNPEPTDHQVTRQRLREHANLNRRLGRDAHQHMFVLHEFERLATKLFKGRIKPVAAQFGKRSRKHDTIKRAVVLTLSDLHFGSDLDADETGFLDYGRTEEARRLAYVVKSTCEYKTEYRAETELILVLDGDLIHGKLHDQQDGAPLAEQLVRTIHLLSQAIAQLAAHFGKVTVICATGNHGRMLQRHPGRATVGKFDSHETVIYSSLKMIASALKNVTFSIPLRPYDVFELFGKKYFATHGDTVIQVGNPGKKVETEKIEAQINRWNASLKGADEYSVFIFGHVHTPLVHHMANGAWVVVNGCMIPADNYVVSLGIPETVSDQVLFEATPNYPVGDFRFITLDQTADKDATLDQIIKPWEGF